MIKLEAKSLSIEVWRYLEEHPEIKDKGALPIHIKRKIWALKARCPLCELFIDSDCDGCPLYRGKSCANGRYNDWLAASSVEDRAAAAHEIVCMTEEWEVAE
jgi:hypothetical protein